MGCVLPSISSTSWLAGRERLQQEHPQVRHEILRHAVVGVIKEDFHSLAGHQRARASLDSGKWPRRGTESVSQSLEQAAVSVRQ